jgi:hypothetical protein
MHAHEPAAGVSGASSLVPTMSTPLSAARAWSRSTPIDVSARADRSGQIPSRLADGPHGPQRLVPRAMVAARAEASPRLRRTAERRLGDAAALEILTHRVDELERRLAALERR